MRKILLAGVVAIAAAAALALIRWATPRQALVVGLVLVAVGIPLLVVSRVHLGEAFTVAPKATVLVTRGVYSKIPHPLFFFLDVAFLGLVIALRRWWLLVAWLALVAAHCWAARREARVLEQAFGDAYREYRLRTWW